MTEKVGSEWGPLAALAGEWEGAQGVDIAFGNVEGSMITTPYREKVSLKPFGPVDNGSQHLWGLDYRMAAWRTEVKEENPFHTEVGYWLWDPELGHVMRSFMVPRGQTLIAGGETTVDATSYTMRAELGSTTYGILSNPYLAKAANTTLYEVAITVYPDGSWGYDEKTVITHGRVPAEPVIHTDRNILRRVADA
ncbi:heme-binding beta-barrel domain-containing protein [Frankia sp. AgB32]|uniref:heme-binding beta-barrel domain-containing protein n=1 Tax=Frankia sp. AgB32 TaxID=631119 RepID=UPI00200F5000|nr:heme-binding beta-barrel domain-containing protein [Frankia sp. AgB32]MCK9896993.1 heme-binding beta-barrel domain-containing protein [Frankia sp. AgB32]